MRVSRENAALTGAYTMIAILAVTSYVAEPLTWTFALSIVTLYGAMVLSYYVVFEGSGSDEWRGWTHLFKEAGPIALIFVPGRITWKRYEQSRRNYGGIDE